MYKQPAIAVVLVVLPLLATDVPLPTNLLQGQPVTIAAIIAMVMVVWILVPTVKQAFQFALQVLPAVQHLSESTAKLAENVDDLHAAIKEMQSQNLERDRLIAQTYTAAKSKKR